MKKISLILALLLLLCSFGLLTVACSPKYQLAVIDQSNLLVEPLKNSYQAGEKVTVKVFMIDDADVVAYLDGQDLGKHKVGETDGEYTHWEFYFNMPNHDATLTLETKGGLLPPPDDDKEYSLTVVDPSNLLIEPLKNSYNAGEIVTVKVNILIDADIVAYLDGQDLGKYEVIETNGEYTHWEFHFTMPDHDTTLTFEIKDGFLPPAEETECPDFTLKIYGENDSGSFKLLDKTFTLSEQLGGVVVINFWATWDGPGVADLPYFNQLANQYPEVTVVAIHGISTEDVAEFITRSTDTKNDWRDYNVIFLQDEIDNNVCKTFQALGGNASWPMTLIVDKDGKVTYTKQGAITYDKLVEEVEKTLAEKEYNLTVIDPSNLLVEPLKESYKAGEIVTVKVDILIDAYVVVYLDGQPCEEKVTDGSYDYWEFHFTMPDHDATLTFEIQDGFLIE